MIDREKVLNGLGCCRPPYLCNICPYCKDDCIGEKRLHQDALELIKEQEAEIERLKGELHGFGDLFHALSEKAKEEIARQREHGTGLAHWVDDTGHWIEGDRNGTDTHTRTTGEMIDTFRCSWCGFYQYWKTPFCPNCGSKMGGGEQDATD